MTTTDGRVLSAEPIGSSFCEQWIYVCVNNMLDTDITARLGVSIPGETEEVHDQLRAELCSYLQKALLSIDSDWIYKVTVQPDLNSEEPEVVVEINDPRLMADESEELIIQALRPFMAVRAKRMHRKLAVLSAREMLVPLNFDYGDNALKNSMKLRLPKGLQLMDSRGRKVSASSTEYDHACSLLKKTLKAMLIATGISWEFLTLMATRDGVRLEVEFDGSNPPESHQLNAFERVVAQVLGAFGYYPSTVYDELVFQPTHRHEADIDDSSAMVEYDEYY